MHKMPKDIIGETKDTIKAILKGGLTIAILFGMFMFFRFIGLKGLLGFVCGMSIMAYLILSKNPLLRWVISFATAEYYIDDLKGEKR